MKTYRLITIMNAVQLFILLCTFTAVCQADDDDDFSVSCGDVTGSVGKEVTFTCSVSQQITACCFTKYKFQYPEIYNDSAICEQELPVNLCDESNSFTCRYTPTTAMTEQFRFFVQAKCGIGTSEFTVDVPDKLKWNISRTSQQETAEGGLTFKGCLKAPV
ncbi:hypothetical protein G5714_012290 [Onychostoma macrolepis]|uniref:Uncharacterized protein n=1 Tax=Onychostoma macrolepis TaxID=369639 RepID=A0A7J6CGD1_9TELE|nr:hypothetical protein G5714_012290 [Onychostoma macrolepis]